MSKKIRKATKQKFHRHVYLLSLFKKLFRPEKIIVLYRAKKGTTFKGHYIPYHISPRSFILFRLALIMLVISISSFIIAMIPLVYAQNQLLEAEKHPALLKTASINQPVTNRTFQLVIPKIGLKAPIIPNVNINSEAEYSKALKTGIAQAKGSYLPGETGPVFLFSHSTDTVADINSYNARFYGLKDLEIGDPIEIIYNQKQFSYKVVKKDIISPDDISIIQNNPHSLIMQTCWPPGTDLQRLIVYADSI